MSAHLMADSRREYERGYHDGREGKSFQTPGVMEILAGALVPGIDPVGNQEDYSKGYKDGKEDSKR